MCMVHDLSVSPPPPSKHSQLSARHGRNHAVPNTLVNEPESLVKRRPILATINVGLDTVPVRKITAPLHENGAGASPLVLGMRC